MSWKRDQTTSRSRRWALLGVLLGLLALVVAKTHPAGAPRIERSLVPAASTITPQSAPQPHHVLGHVNDTRPAPSFIRTLTPLRADTISLTSTTTSTTVTTTTEPPIANAQVLKDPALVETGWLEAPDSISASYPLSLASSETATLVWQDNDPLSLSVSCGATATSQSGSSPLSLSVPSGICSVTVSGSSSTPLTTYQLRVGSP